MLRGETTIGKVLARRPSGAELIHARLRLSHLFAGADIAPPGFPPRALLVIRRARAASRVLLTSGVAVSARDALERELREQVSTLWRRAARPVRGRIPAGADAVLFEDEGEWLAALGLACARREAWSHWCWREWHRADAAVAPTRALVRGWAESPRFIPAALVRLARWGEAARVLGALQPGESGALLSALRSEFQLPSPPRLPASRDTRGETGGDRQHETRLARQTTTDGEHASAAPSRGGGGTIGQERPREDPSGRAHVEAPGATPPPWGRWLPSDGGACERLHATSRAILSFAAALFHAPSLARSRDFATEVFAYNESRDAPAPPPADAAQPPGTRSRRAESLPAAERQSVDERPRGTVQADAARDTSREPSVEADGATRPALGRDEAGQTVETPKTRTARSDGAGESKRVGATSAAADVEDEEVSTAEGAAPWAGLDGCETRLGGALFLLNLFMGLRLPECFDEEYALSEQVTGWGLTELFARELLGETVAEFEDDPLWGALAHLDGRAAGEPPADGLRVGHAYRAPARWLKLFAPREGEDAWRASVVKDALVITHAAGFPVAVLPLEGRDAAALAARLADDYRADGLSVLLKNEGGGWQEEGDAYRNTLILHPSSFTPSPDELRRWMSWTFPFLKYALRRSLADAGGVEDEGAARALLVRRGRLYCTATHVDLVLELSGLSFEARRAGLDASPGWVRDLMRVVAFHFE